MSLSQKYIDVLRFMGRLVRLKFGQALVKSASQFCNGWEYALENSEMCMQQAIVPFCMPISLFFYLDMMSTTLKEVSREKRLQYIACFFILIENFAGMVKQFYRRRFKLHAWEKIYQKYHFEKFHHVFHRKICDLTFKIY